jgi:hypothetical protein
VGNPWRPNGRFWDPPRRQNVGEFFQSVFVGLTERSLTEPYGALRSGALRSLTEPYGALRSLTQPYGALRSGALRSLTDIHST